MCCRKGHLPLFKILLFGSASQAPFLIVIITIQLKVCGTGSRGAFRAKREPGNVLPILPVCRIFKRSYQQGYSVVKIILSLFFCLCFLAPPGNDVMILFFWRTVIEEGKEPKKHNALLLASSQQKIERNGKENVSPYFTNTKQRAANAISERMARKGDVSAKAKRDTITTHSQRW